MSDSRAGAVGGVTLMLDIIEMSIIPMLTFGCETWFPLPKKTLDDLNKFSNAALKAVFGLPKTGAPLASMYIDSATFLMKNRILKQQILFVHHLATLSDNSLAKEFYISQKQQAFPGVVTMCQEVLKDFNLVNIERYSKYQFRTIVKQLIFNKNRNEILEWAKGYKKINHDTCSKEKFERKGYLTKLNVADARLYFRIKYFLIPTFRLDYKNIHKYRAEKWLCPECVERLQRSRPPPNDVELSCEQDSHDHARYNCPSNNQLRKNTDFSDPEQEVVFSWPKGQAL